MKLLPIFNENISKDNINIILKKYNITCKKYEKVISDVKKVEMNEVNIINYRKSIIK